MSMTDDLRRSRVTVGVDTHKYVHVAVALDAIGGTIATASFAADSSGYQQLSEWAVALARR